MKDLIMNGGAFLGIEFGSTNIKAVLINDKHEPIASGTHGWENQFENGVWTYSLDAIWNGLQDCYKNLRADVMEKYGVSLKKVAAIGFSGMMHGYMAFNAADELMVPFRTWRNTITGEASEKLMEVFNYPIPQRWTIAHLYQAILNKEPHVKDIAHVTTLAGYIHWKMTGKKVLGIGEASGVFPIDTKAKQFNGKMLAQFNELICGEGFSWKVEDVLPAVMVAGENAGYLTEEGAKLLDVSGELEAGIPMCPPEGDAGTGMTATNSVAPRTGNVSAGTSVFSMIVLEDELKKVHKEIDQVTTPAGDLVAMVHCNNCTSDLNAWMGLLKEVLGAFGASVDTNTLYTTLFTKALEGDADCGGLLSYNYFSGEHVTGFDEGRPVLARSPYVDFTLANFMRVQLYSCFGALKTGMDILLKEEGVKVDEMFGHGGLFKTPVVGQKVLSAAINAPVCVMKTAGEGGPWGQAIHAAYMIQKEEGESLGDYLNNKVFQNSESSRVMAEASDVQGFDEFMTRYAAGLPMEQAAINAIK